MLAVTAKAQFFGYGGYYPVAPAAPVAYHGVPAAAVPAVVPAYGYSSFTSTQYDAQDEVGQARFGAKCMGIVGCWICGYWGIVIPSYVI